MDNTERQINMRKWLCGNCSRITLEFDLLKAPHPFDPADEVTGCPTCRTIPTFVPACDVDDCQQPATSGWPSAAGYRQTCAGHASGCPEQQRAG